MNNGYCIVGYCHNVSHHQTAASTGSSKIEVNYDRKNVNILKESQKPSKK